MLRVVLLVFVLWSLFPRPSAAVEFELRSELEALARDQSHLHAFQVQTFTLEIAPDLRFGAALFSAAVGRAGGSFLGGFTLERQVRLGPRSRLAFGATLGGGGGVWVVDGDGLLARVHLAFLHDIGRDLSLALGASRVRVSGTGIDTPALTFGLAHRFDLAVSRGHGRMPPPVVGAFEIVEATPFVQRYLVGDSLRRGGGALSDLAVIGGSFVFATPDRPRVQTFLEASGATFGGGGGFAQWQVGRRWVTARDGPRLHARLGAGFGGGGGVHTGPGLLVSAGAGATIPLGPQLDLEAGVTAYHAVGGKFSALAPHLATVFRLQEARAGGPMPRRWALSLGLSQQQGHPGFRKDISTARADPLLVESSLDYLVTPRSYVFFNAQTAASGEAGGYAVGQVGLGHRVPVSARWTIAAEAFVGAAGGDGVETGGGFIVGGRLELDYRLAGGSRLYVGAGQFASQGSARPVTLHAGLRVPFSTWTGRAGG